MDYRLLIDLDVLEFAERLPKRLKDPIRQAFASIQNNPEDQSDAEDYDDQGRPLRIKIVGDFALTYWVDHADRHVKILDIHSADR